MTAEASPIRTCAAIVAASWLAACSMAPPPSTPDPVLGVPEEFARAEIPGAAASFEWWTSFGDPALDVVVDTALVANLDLAEAVGRVEEARALARVAGAARFPAVDASASAGESRTPSNSGFGEQLAQLLGGLLGRDSTDAPGDDDPGEGDDDGERGRTRRITSTTWSTSLGVSYEVDFWGRIGADAAAATRDLLASEADLRVVRLGVISETISAYLQLQDLGRRSELTERTVEILTEREALTEERYDRGLVSSFELYQVRQDLRNAQASLPLLEAQVVDARSRLAVLLGRYSVELDGLVPDSVGATPVTEPVPVGVPASLLAQRPDVRAAAERYEAARLRIGARKAELFPRLTLSGSVGLQSTTVGGLFDLDQWTSNLLAGLTAPLFQGGRLRANVDAAEARYAQRAAAFARVVVTAVEEVETALARYRESRRRYDFLRSQLTEAEASVSLLARRYASGVAGYVDYLDAVRSQLAVRSTLSAAGQELSLALLGVHRALGGGWTAPAAAGDPSNSSEDVRDG